jgi:hypothetical protein
MISEGDIQSIQRKVSLKGPKFVRKIDDMILNFIDFYVPRLNSTEASLKLSQKMTLFAVFRLYTGAISKENLSHTRYFWCTPPYVLMA